MAAFKFIFFWLLATAATGPAVAFAMIDRGYDALAYGFYAMLAVGAFAIVRGAYLAGTVKREAR